MTTCTRCGSTVPTDAYACFACGQKITPDEPSLLQSDPSSAAGALREAGHIEYLLAQVPNWERRRIVTPWAASVLAREYSARRAAILAPAPAPSAPQTVTVASGARAASAAASAPAPPAWATAPAGAMPTGQPTLPPVYAAAVSAAAPPAAIHVAQRPAQHTMPSAPSLAQFLEAHWLKLLAVLAAALLFAGMRQILGQEWMSAYAVTAVPLLPIGLCALFYRYGTHARSRGAGEIGAFAYCAVAIGLAACAVLAVDRYWLHGALAPRPAALVALAIATTLATWTRWRSADARFDHIALAGGAGVLFAALQTLWPSSFFEPAPALLYGTVYLGFAAVLFTLHVAAQRGAANHQGSAAPGTRHPSSVGAHPSSLIPHPGFPQAPPVRASGTSLLIWAHLSAVAALALTLRPLMESLQLAAMDLPTALLVGATAAVYLIAAQSMASEGMAYLGGAMAASSAALVLASLPGHHIDPYGCGFAAIVLCAAALGFSVLNARHVGGGSADSGRTGLAEAYAGMAAVAAAVAGGALLYRLGESITGGAPLGGPDWPRGVLLAALCAGAYALLAWRSRRPDVMWAAWLAAAFGITLATDRLGSGLHPSSLILHPLALDLLPFAVVALTVAHLLRARIAEVADRGADPWAAPPLWCAFAAAAASCALAVDSGGAWVSGGVWTVLVACTLLGVAGAALTLRDADLTATRLWAALALAAMTCGAYFAGGRLANTAAWGAQSGQAIAVLLAGGVWLAAAVGVGRTNGGETDTADQYAASSAPSDYAASSVPTPRVRGMAAWTAPLTLAVLVCSAYGAGLALLAPSLPTAPMTAIAAVGWALAALVAVASTGWRPTAEAGERSTGTLRLEGASWAPLDAACSLGILVAAAARLAAIATEPYGASGAAGAALVVFALAAAGAYGAAGWRLRSPGAMWMAVAALALSSTGAALFGGASGSAWAWVTALAALALAASTIPLGGAARWAFQPALGWAAAAAACAAWELLVVRLAGVPAVDRGLAALPLAAGFYAAALLQRRDWERELGAPLGRSGLLVAVLASGYAVAVGLDRLIEQAVGASVAGTHAASPTVTATLLAYAAAFLVGAVLSLRGRQGDEAPARDKALPGMACAWTTGAAAAHMLIAGWYAPQCACGLAVVAAVWLVLARALEAWRSAATDLPSSLSRAAYGAATATAVIAAVGALLSAGAQGQGIYTLLALAAAGCVFLGLMLLRPGASAQLYGHAAFASLFAGYALYLYDRLNISQDTLPYYLIPVGLYLMALGHIASRRQRESADAAGALWWLGLLTAITPTFAAFYHHSATDNAPAFTVLLLIECFVAVAWGIAHRIRAFVLAGAAFLLAYTAVLARGAVEQVWSGLVAVGLGVALLALVFTLSVHQEAVRRWIERVGSGWRAWR